MKKLITIIFILIATVSYSQPFAKIQENTESGDYVNVATLEYCNIIFGRDIYTPQGKVTKTNLQGFTECPNLPECLVAINVDEKHSLSDTMTSVEANAYAKEQAYITYIWKQKIYKTK
jgi:hypothetical protein